MIASFKGHFMVVKKLIEAGAKINQANKVGIASVLLHTLTSTLHVYKYCAQVCISA